ncbi:phospho-N-acetylmuramoyl-pentapeptide-transferase [Thiovulum sp. ES]|nr:phospho-N-acetylmuramoyl-pentapeptide-transferase [Thiovulum sp. ES]
MLYELYLLFDINVFQYITFRAGFGFILSLFLVLFLMPVYIRWAKSKSFQQPIHDSVKQHSIKGKTPTMGGLVFVFATLFSSLMTIHCSNIYAIGGVLAILFFSGIGIVDDLGKVLGKKNSGGLSAKMKMLLLILLSTIIGVILYNSGFSTELYMPFMKNSVLEMGIYMIPFAVLVMISTSNAVNLTDGLDGLATVPSIFSVLTLSIFAYLSGNAILSEYLLLPDIDGIGEVAIIGASLTGALTGFLWYNAHPAEVFMGDSGSLAIGGFLGYLAIVTKNEILLILIGLIFVVEAMTVILQVASFKTRKKRIFLMTPIHHHFEMKNWHENKIIVRFWIISLLSNLVALISIKIR